MRPLCHTHARARCLASFIATHLHVNASGTSHSPRLAMAVPPLCNPISVCPSFQGATNHVGWSNCYGQKFDIEESFCATRVPGMAEWALNGWKGGVCQRWMAENGLGLVSGQRCQMLGILLRTVWSGFGGRRTGHTKCFSAVRFSSLSFQDWLSDWRTFFNTLKTYLNSVWWTLEGINKALFSRSQTLGVTFLLLEVEGTVLLFSLADKCWMCEVPDCLDSIVSARKCQGAASCWGFWWCCWGLRQTPDRWLQSDR